MHEKWLVLTSFFEASKDYLLPLFVCLGMIILKRLVSYAIVVLKQIEALMVSVSPLSVVFTFIYLALLLYSRYGQGIGPGIGW